MTCFPLPRVFTNKVHNSSKGLTGKNSFCRWKREKEAHTSYPKSREAGARERIANLRPVKPLEETLSQNETKNKAKGLGNGSVRACYASTVTLVQIPEPE